MELTFTLTSNEEAPIFCGSKTIFPVSPVKCPVTVDVPIRWFLIIKLTLEFWSVGIYSCEYAVEQSNTAIIAPPIIVFILQLFWLKNAYYGLDIIVAKILCHQLVIAPNNDGTFFTYL